MANVSSNDSKRLITRWELNDTVKKTEYSWIQKAIDKEIKKIVLLEFIKHKDIDSNNLLQTHIINIFKTSFTELLVHGYIHQLEQEYIYMIPKQLIHIILIYSIRTDTFHVIQAIQHSNIHKLYGYHLNASYPTTSEQKDETQYLNTMFFVYEYIDTELFDLIHYRSSLKENITRTFFKQILNGLEVLHNKGIIYGTLQPKHILIDNNLQIKLTGYAHTYIYGIDSQKTNYTAPELYLGEQPNSKSDIFSLAVILFILLSGYPPFEQAYKTDKWFKPLIKKAHKTFWKAYKKTPVSKMSDAKDLLTKMFCVDPAERITISDIKCHSWLNGDILSCQELIAAIAHGHMLAEKRRELDIIKQNDVSLSLDRDRNTYMIPTLNDCCINFTLYPKDGIATEGLIGEVYSYLGDVGYVTRTTARHGLYGLVEEALADFDWLAVEFDFDQQILLCKYSFYENNKKKQQGNDITGRFSIQIFESRLWKDKYKELSVSEIEKIKSEQEDVIFVVEMNRIQGDELAWLRLKKGVLLIKTNYGSLFKGLPNWARKMKMKRTFQKKDQEVQNVDVYDSYYNTLLKYEVTNCF